MQIRMQRYPRWCGFAKCLLPNDLHWSNLRIDCSIYVALAADGCLTQLRRYALCICSCRFACSSSKAGQHAQTPACGNSTVNAYSKVHDQCLPGRAWHPSVCVTRVQGRCRPDSDILPAGRPHWRTKRLVGFRCTYRRSARLCYFLLGHAQFQDSAACKAARRSSERL